MLFPLLLFHVETHFACVLRAALSMLTVMAIRAPPAATKSEQRRCLSPQTKSPAKCNDTVVCCVPLPAPCCNHVAVQGGDGLLCRSRTTMAVTSFVPLMSCMAAGVLGMNA